MKHPGSASLLPQTMSAKIYSESDLNKAVAEAVAEANKNAELAIDMVIDKVNTFDEVNAFAHKHYEQASETASSRSQYYATLHALQVAFFTLYLVLFVLAVWLSHCGKDRLLRRQLAWSTLT